MDVLRELDIGEGRVAKLQRDPAGALSVLVVDGPTGTNLGFVRVADRTPEALRAALVDALAIVPAVSEARPRFDIDAATNALLDGFFAMDYPLEAQNTSLRDWFYWARKLEAMDALATVGEAAPSRLSQNSSLQGADLTAYALSTAAYALRFVEQSARLSTQSRAEVLGMSFPAFVRLFATVAATSDNLAVGPLGEAWERALRRRSATKPRYTEAELVKFPRARARDADGRSVVVMLVNGDRVVLKRATSKADLRERIREEAALTASWPYAYPFAMTGGA